MNKYLNDCDGDEEICLSFHKKEAKTFDAGVESERKKHEWHDLSKNPKDLPDNDRYVVVKSAEWITIAWYFKKMNIWQSDNTYLPDYENEIIAWKEIK